LRAARETWERSHALKIQGIDFTAVQNHIARLFELNPEDLLLPGKYPKRVAARSVFCYLPVRGLGMTCTAVAKRLGIGQQAVSIALARGDRLAKEKGLTLPDRIK
jgi:putative transposase